MPRGRTNSQDEWFAAFRLFAVVNYGYESLFLVFVAELCTYFQLGGFRENVTAQGTHLSRPNFTCTTVHRSFCTLNFTRNLCDVQISLGTLKSHLYKVISTCFSAEITFKL
jgi:hypothetical protein